MVTFIVFPGVTCAQSLQYLNSYAWFSLLTVTLFNVFDTLGRYVGGVRLLQIPRASSAVHWIGFGRFVCVAVAIGLLVQNYDRAWLQVANTAVLGVTNGYLQSVCCCYAPTMCSEREQGTLGNLIVVMITLGISVGGAIQIPLSKL